VIEAETGGTGLKLAFLLCLGLGLGFGAHATWRIASGTGFAPDPMADWMTPAHVSAVFGIPPEHVAEVLGITGALPFASLRDLAAERGETSDALIARLQAELP
jgi:hypothetical protein